MRIATRIPGASAVLVSVLLALSALACVKRAPISGARCPCPASHCCIEGKCVLPAPGVMCSPDGGTSGITGAGGGGGAAGSDAAVEPDGEADGAVPMTCGPQPAELGVVPLFSGGDAVNPPVVFKRDDGVIVTRGAGRVRSRHEGPFDIDRTFMEWAPSYFLMRTYGWIIEDYTPLGQSKLAVTLMPLGPLKDMTPFRAWKAYNSGDVFTMNVYMSTTASLPDMRMGGRDFASQYALRISPVTQMLQEQLTANFRVGGDAPIERGDLCEIELSLLYTTTLEPLNSRPNYFTDTFRYRVGEGGITADNRDPYGKSGNGVLGPVTAAQLGGDTTSVWAYYLQETQFDQVALNVQHENVQAFVEGRRLFHTDFSDGTHRQSGAIAIEPFPEQAGKANLQAQQTACQDCHLNNGPGEVMKNGLPKSSMVVKLYESGALGAQLQPRDGSAGVTGLTTKNVLLGNGQSVHLTKPTIVVTTMGGATPRFSARIATKLVGLGLLEAIDERAILAHADPLDCNADGISGRANLVDDLALGVRRVGRFGWKAEAPTLAHVTASDALASMGVGTSLFPDPGKTTELEDAELAKLVTYVRLLAVPGQRQYGEESVSRGERLFQTVGCAACHATDLVTGPNHPFAELRGQAIKPYTDLLLHDMGPDLADDSLMPPPDARDPFAPPSASEWRTPPLWGIGLLGTINGHTGLLHDGRAANVLEAVVWHGGEASRVRTTFINLPAEDRAALLDFVSSL